MKNEKVDVKNDHKKKRPSGLGALITQVIKIKKTPEAFIQLASGVFRKLPLTFLSPHFIGSLLRKVSRRGYCSSLKRKESLMEFLSANFFVSNVCVVEHAF